MYGTAYTVGKRLFITSLTIDPATGIEIATVSATAEIYYLNDAGEIVPHSLTDTPVALAQIDAGNTSFWGGMIDFSEFIPNITTSLSNTSQLRFQNMVVLIRATIGCGIMSCVVPIRGGPGGPMFSIGLNSPSMP